MEGLANGINNSKYLVKNAVDGLSNDMKNGLTTNINLQSQNATITHVIDNYSSAQNKDKQKLIQVNLQVGSKTIASALTTDLGQIIAKKQSARGITKGVLPNI